jgi:hypothetical protein
MERKKLAGAAGPALFEPREGEALDSRIELRERILRGQD